MKVRLVFAAIACVAALANTSVLAGPLIRQLADGSVEIDGRKLNCSPVRTLLNSRLPNLGISIPGERLLVINPAALRRYPESVRLFVFLHECGHHHVGASELKADCWAVEHGVHDGWLNLAAVGEVCRSFGNAPATSTHPSAVRRCRNLDRCYASAMPSRPVLVSGLQLVREGTVRASRSD